MWIIALKIFVICVGSALFVWGGYNWHNARRFILPCLLAAMALFLSHSLWSLTMLSSMGAFCLGYGDKSPLRHSLGNAWGRSVWGLIAATCLSLPLFLTHHLGAFGAHQQSTAHASLLEFFPILTICFYCALNFILENALKNINQIIGDLIIGAGFASIVFLIR